MTQKSILSSAGLVAWTAGLATAWWFLRTLGGGPLSAPPVTSWSELTQWAQLRDEAEIVMAFLRLLAMASIVYLFVLSMLAVALRVVRIERTARIDRLLPQWLVGMLDSSLRVGLVASMGIAAVGLPAPGTISQPDAELAQGVPSGSVLIATPMSADHADNPSSTLVMTPLESTGDSDPAWSLPAASAKTVGPVDLGFPVPGTSSTSPEVEAAAPVEVLVTAPSAAETTWVTQSGDHLWAIAEETVAEHGETHDQPAVDRYWRELIEENRDVLLDPNNPDLIVPGQVFTLPPVS